jgi:OOP family OmpA-OmpF porin
MKKFLLVALSLVATSVVAADNWQNGNGTLQWRNGDGTLCWRDSSWTPATAAPGCDGWVSPKPAVKTVSTTKVTLQADTLFDFDKSTVKPEGQVMLDKLVAQIKSIQLEVIVAVGNTDNVGTDAYNLALGQRRAQAVKLYLISQGIPAVKIYTESKGKSNPVASNATAKGRSQNRRVELEVVGK